MKSVMAYIQLAEEDNEERVKLIEEGPKEMANLELTIKDKQLLERFESLEIAMKEIKPAHKNLYIIMTWKMSKLLAKLAGTQDESTPYGLGIGKSMITSAKAYLQKSK